MLLISFWQVLMFLIAFWSLKQAKNEEKLGIIHGKARLKLNYMKNPSFGELQSLCQINQVCKEENQRRNLTLKNFTTTCEIFARQKKFLQPPFITCENFVAIFFTCENFASPFSLEKISHLLYSIAKILHLLFSCEIFATPYLTCKIFM